MPAATKVNGRSSTVVVHQPSSQPQTPPKSPPSFPSIPSRPSSPRELHASNPIQENLTTNGGETTEILKTIKQDDAFEKKRMQLPHNPPPSPITVSPFVTEDRLASALEHALRMVKRSQEVAESSTPSDSRDSASAEQLTDKSESNGTRVRASKMDYREVDELWDEKEYKYKIKDSVSASTITELDEYIFVVRQRYEKNSTEPKSYIDIKSEELGNVLRDIFQGLKAVSLESDKPTMDKELLFTCLPKMKSYISSEWPAASETGLKHLALLIDCIESTYTESSQRLEALCAQQMITYDLLKFLFKPEEIICAACPGTGKPRALIYDFGKEKETRQGIKYFELSCRYIDFDGRVFEEVQDELSIFKFHGAIPISKLSASPLQYHPQKDTIERYLRRFQEVNPGYPKLQNRVSCIDLFNGTASDRFEERVKCTDKRPGELSENDLLVCTPTVLGFSLGDKFWGEFAIDNISEIEWLPAPFDRLVLPHDRKEIIKAIADTSSGPPGVGKTGTAESLAETHKRPLYSVSAGQLSSDAAHLDRQLGEILRTASHWKALLLLDEADVFLTQRSTEHIERNRLVATFLHKLEYYDGVMFLTTNQPTGLDSAIRNRVHLTFHYSDLNNDARREVFAQYLTNNTKLQVNINEQELDSLALVKLNGRESQIKNHLSIACTLAANEGRLKFAHIQRALMVNGHVVPKLGGQTLSMDLYDE
ncbi:hypothetical protein BDFG_01016 [Blastomyces dermatitidis ATCC 26199]|nr:hypothetical protein BDFG_01016 [Blastomyces dermatitidis ATCC 26199]